MHVTHSPRMHVVWRSSSSQSHPKREHPVSVVPANPASRMQSAIPNETQNFFMTTEWLVVPMSQDLCLGGPLISPWLLSEPWSVQCLTGIRRQLPMPGVTTSSKEHSSLQPNLSDPYPFYARSVTEEVQVFRRFAEKTETGHRFFGRPSVRSANSMRNGPLADLHARFGRQKG